MRWNLDDAQRIWNALFAAAQHEEESLEVLRLVRVQPDHRAAVHHLINSFVSLVRKRKEIVEDLRVVEIGRAHV